MIVKKFVLSLSIISATYSQILYPNCAGAENDGSCSLPICPDCDFIDCLPKLNSSHCPPKTILEPNLAVGGCCPACVRYLEEGKNYRNFGNFHSYFFWHLRWKMWIWRHWTFDKFILTSMHECSSRGRLFGRFWRLSRSSDQQIWVWISNCLQSIWIMRNPSKLWSNSG